MSEAEFIEKFLKKIDKIDRGSLQAYVQDLKGEQEFLQTIVDSLSAGVLMIGSDGRIKFMNRGAKSLLGISHSVSPRSKSFLQDVIADKDLREFLSGHLHSPDHVIQHEIEVFVPQHAHLSVSISPVFDAGHVRQGCVVLLVNATFFREHERKVKGLQKLDSLMRLAAGIAHEIGNPLNSIGIHIKLLEREIESLSSAARERGEALLDVIRAETKRLDRMVRGFLKATRQTPLRLREANINEIIEDATTFLQPEMKQANVRPQLKLSKAIPPFLMDAQKMRQVFINVIKNAIQSMPRGGKLEISSVRFDRLCSLLFKDDGVGISEEDLPHIFETYFTTKKEGSGLGLMIVSDIVQQHGGRIEVKSKPGHGTTFSILLPIRREKLQLPEKVLKVGT